MATVRESMLDMMDAAASVDTAAMMSADDTFVGNITPGDEDWIAIELTEGNMYTITVGGMEGGTLNDSVLKLIDGKGDVIDMNDDKEGDKGDLSSEIKFSPETGSGTQTYYISVSGNSDNPGSPQMGTYTVSVMEVAVLPAGEGADIAATDDDDHKLVGTADGESIAGMGGNDVLIGGAGDDTLSGGGGNDLLNGGPGADKINGGAGDMDTVTYNGSAMGVSINLRAGTASGGDAEGDTLGDDIENVMGSNQDDMLSGSRVANMIWGLRGNDDLFGDKGGDTLRGGAGDDMLDGGDGDDTLIGGPGADELTGGEDDDTASYAGSMMGVTVRLHTGQADYGDAEGDTWGDMVTVEYDNPDPEAPKEEAVLTETVPDIVNLTGSGMDDILAGDSRANEIDGGGGDDKIYGGPGGGDDVLMGGMGDDMVWGGIGADTLRGGDGDDMLHGGPGSDTFYGGAGSDMIYAESTDAVINGWVEDPPDDPDNPGTPLTEAAEDPDAVDTVSFARLKSGIGDSTTAWALSSAPNVENVIGTSEDDYIDGTTGNNMIEGGDGADALDGSDGTDTVSYENSDRRVSVTVDADGSTSPSGGHAQGDTIDNFENATGSAHDDILTGDEGMNTLKGLAGDDELSGLAGSDTIEGGAGADEMNGGTSSTSAGATDDDGADTEPDTLSYASSDAGVNANLATNTYSGGHADGDEVEVERDAYDPDGDGDGDPVDVSTFENLTGSMHDDRLTGDHRVNVIMGGDGDDTISGGGANDELHGGKGDDSIKGDAGSDHLIGGPGADRLDGGEMKGERDNTIPNPAFDDTQPVSDANPRRVTTTELDWAVYRPAMAGVTVDLSEGRGTGGDAMGDRLIGIEVIWGSKHDDTIIASADEDTYDIIHGDSGADTVSYEASEMPVMVDLGDDNDNTSVTLGGTGTADDPFTFTYAPADDTPLVAHTDDEGVAGGDATTNGAFGDRLGGISNLTGSDHNDTLEGDDNPNVLKGGAGNDDLDGEGQADMLYGGAGRDSLAGDGGTDTLNGGAGDDELTGGTEADTFVFAPGHGDDVINDLAADADKIDLTAFDLDSDDLAGLLRTRGEGTNARVIIDLQDLGGGTIELVGIDSVDDLDTDTTTADLATNGMLDLAETDGVVDTGVFIL